MISGDRSLAQGKQGAFYNTLEEFHKYWDRVDVICPNPGGRKSEVINLFGNVFVHPSIWPLIFQPLWIYREGSRILKNGSWAVKNNNWIMTVHDYPPFYNGLGAYLLSLRTRIPYVLEIMHIPGLPKAASVKEFVYKHWTRFFIYFDAYRARAVRIINQQQTKDFLIKSGVGVSKIKYIPAFYINLDIFKPESLEKKYDLVYVARLEKNKGISNLVEAAAILKNSNPELKLLIIGQGPELDSLKSKIKDLKLENNIEFSGWLNGPADVAKLLNQSRIFVNPSLNEGGPRVALEAMACGVPVITTRVGVMIDVVSNAENGLFCDWIPSSMARTISMMLNDQNLQEKCSAGGLALVEQFRYEPAISNYAKEIQKISEKRLLVITQKVDVHDQLLGFFIEWLKRLGQTTNLSVLCLEEGQHDGLSVPVASLGKEKRASRLSQLVSFYRYIIKNSKNYDTVFVHMSPIWVVLGGLYWRLKGKKIILWYTSKGVTLKLRIANYLSNLILTASKESFRLGSKKLVVTGHGIDTELFKPRPFDSSELKIITVGRITPIKNYEVLVEACKKLKDEGLNFSLTIVGEPALKSDHKYLQNLKMIIAESNLSENVKFIGRVDHNKLPSLYSENKIFVHMSKTGSLDKVILEAMACGVTVLSSNDSARSFLPAEYLFEENSSEDLANKMKYAFNNPSNFREYVASNHSLDKLVSKIISFI